MHVQQYVEIAMMILNAFLRLMFSPFFWIVIFLVVYQYYHMQKSKEAQFGIPRQPLHEHMAAIGFGLAGGLVGSFIMVLVGISLNDIGITWLWPVAILLMLINPRFLCFSYAAGLISLCYLLFGFPRVDIAQLMALVALLHMVEAMLILLSGHLGAVPVFTRNKMGRVIGAFNLQRFWPIPFVALTAVAVPDAQAMNEFIRMPDWWPLIKPAGLELNMNMVYQLLPVVAALGYGDIAATSRPQEKSRRSAVNLFIFSFVLLGLSVLASNIPQTAVLAVLFSPLGHEWVIWLGQKGELTGKPFYVDPERGVMVLDVYPGSPAAKLGLETGDIIISINSQPVNSKYDLSAAADLFLGIVEAEWLQYPGNNLITKSIRKKLGESFGVILAPGPYDTPVMEFRSSGLLARWLKRFKKRLLHQ